MVFFFESESRSSSSSSSEEEYLCSRDHGYKDTLMWHNIQIMNLRAILEYQGVPSRSLCKPGRQAISCEFQLMALWKMGRMDSYRSICDQFNVGRATAVRAVQRVTAALFLKAPIFVQWPNSDRAATVIQGFAVARGFPNSIGAIDGTHICIHAPKENAVDYVNRKGYHSIQLQVMCDHRMLITHCYTGHPGLVHDARVFRQSEVADSLEDGEKFPHDSHLLGDAAYELHERLLTPF